jgi:hypothetical protein
VAKSRGAPSAHVTPRSGGREWAATRGGAQRAAGLFPTQGKAEHRARELLENVGGGELVIHDRQGRIRSKDTVAGGNDPNPPRDMEH